MTASATIRNPQTFNRYAYALNSPYKFTDPLGLAPDRYRWFCEAMFSTCSDSSANSSISISDENELITINLNIVYDANQMDESSARESMKEAIEDLQKVFSSINVQFKIRFRAGKAEMSPSDNPECENCAYNIVKGAVNGEINVFLHDNTRNLRQSVSYFRPENAQIFIERVAGSSIKQKLAHEVSHLFRYFVNGDPRGGFPLPAFTGAGWTFVGSNNHYEDAIINDSLDRMRKSNLEYGFDYVDDYTKVFYSEITPGRTANILGELAPRRLVQRIPTSFDIFRLGAIRVARQSK